MWSDLRIRLRSLFRRGRAEAELDDELRFHLEEAERRNLGRGMDPVEARRQARIELGGVEQIKEAARDARGVRLIEDLARDFRHAGRRLVRDWRFSAAAALVLTLGIGANTAIFSVVDAALFRKQPFADPDRLVNIYQNVAIHEGPGTTAMPEASSYPAYEDMASYTDLFSAVGATTIPMDARYRAGEGVRPAVVEFATSTYLGTLGLRPAQGRWFEAREDLAGGENVAVLSHRAWRTRFAADPGILGRSLRVNGLPVTVVGVGPEDFSGSISMGIVTDLWLSVSCLPPVTGGAGVLTRKGGIFLVKARLREGVTTPQVRAAMDALGERLAADFPDDDPGHGITVLREDEVRVHPLIDRALAPGASILVVSVGLVLAIACTNLATLLIVRGAARGRELSLRLSLGATRAQVVRHLLAESLLLSFLGGAAGCLLAGAALRYLSRVDLPIDLDLRLDLRVLGFTVALAVLTGVAVGLAPALKATRLDLLPALREEGESLSLERRWFTLKNALVVVQVVVSFLLLVGTSFSLRMLVQSRSQEVGFAVGGVAMLETDTRYGNYSPERSRAVLVELRERVAALPGVEATALTAGTPMQVHGGLKVDTGNDPTTEPWLQWIWGEPDTFETLGIPILYGRGFDDRDRPDTPAAAVLNESAARRYFGTVNAVGRRLRPAHLGAHIDSPTEGLPDFFEVVGVVPDTMTVDLGDEIKPMFFRSLTQAERPPTTVVARSSRDASSLLGAMQRELRAIDPVLPVVRGKTMERQLEDSLLALKVIVSFLASLALVGLGLACVGLYAVVAYAVSQRAKEVGIRTALGGRIGQVTWAISRDVGKLMGFAVASAAALSLVAIQLLKRVDMANPAPGMHLNVPTVDAGTLPFVALIMLFVGILAAYLPARRAAKADPLVVLRHE